MEGPSTVRLGGSPALTLAAGAALGLVAVARLEHLPVGPTAALLALALAWRRRGGLWIAALALGGLLGWVRVEEPRRSDPVVADGAAVTALLRPIGAFRPAEGGWGAPARVASLRRGAEVAVAPRRVWLFVGGADPPPAPGEWWARGIFRRGEPAGNRGWGAPPGASSPDRLSVKSRLLLDRRDGAGENGERGPGERLEALVREVGGGDRSARVGVQLALALVLGQPARLDEDVRRALRDWGLAHLTAASGLHVGIVAVSVGVFTAWGGGRRRWLLPAAAVLGYCLLVGERPSLLRAAAMLGLAWAARGAGRSPRPLHALGLAALLLLIVEPTLHADLGFRLSFAATFGILALAPRLRLAWRGPDPLKTPLAVSVAAQLATLPFTVTTFATVPLLAPVLNLVFVPWTALCLLGGGVWLSLRMLGVPADPGWLVPLAWPFEWLAARPAPWWATPTWTPSLWLAATVSVAIGLGLARPRLRVALPALLAIAAATTVSSRVSAPEAWMIDVGQGDAFVLRSGRSAILIDGGGWRGGDLARRVLLPALSRLGVRRIDLAVLSHPDVDHCDGLAGLVGRIRLGAVWLGPGADQAACGARLAAGAGPRVREVRGGEVAEVAGWRLEVAPLATAGSSNRRSVVVAASVDGARVLFTGDLDAGGERSLLASGFELRADVLKVAHHGSRTSSTERFLAAVDPRWALISAGRGNAYGHPAPTVVERLLGRGATVLRSDLDGRVGLRFLPRGRVVFDPERLRWWSGGPRPALRAPGGARPRAPAHTTP